MAHRLCQRSSKATNPAMAETTTGTDPRPSRRLTNVAASARSGKPGQQRYGTANPAGPQRPASALRRQFGLTTSFGVGREKRRCQKRVRQHRQRSAHPRGRTGPTGPDVAAVQGHASVGDATGDHAQEERGDQRRVAKTTPSNLASSTDAANLRKANAAPRSTIPRPTSIHGTNNVVMIAANTGGEPTTRNQHEDQPHVIGFPHRADRVVDLERASDRRARRCLRVRSQTPVPKSAPAKIA